MYFFGKATDLLDPALVSGKDDDVSFSFRYIERAKISKYNHKIDQKI